MVDFNGALYSYVHNLQGDVVGIVDSAGSLVVEYKYDAWGKPTLARTLTTAYEALAELNPFRYRGYVFDEETGLYYLRDRYYNLNTVRFISADVYVNSSDDSVLFSVYCYCSNKPIILYDEAGTWPSFADVCKAIAVTALIVAGAALVVAAAPVVAVAGAATVSTGALSVAGIALETAIVATGVGLVYEAQRHKPINLPSAKRITLNMDHIMSGHGSGGNRGGPRKDRFPDWVTSTIAERIIRTAYKYGEKILTQGDRILVRGPWDGTRFIEMWVNVRTNVIETAWPKYN